MSSGMIRPHMNSLALMFRAVDSIVIFSALIFSANYFGIPLYIHYISAGLLGVLIFWLLAESQDLYRSWRSNKFIEQAFSTAMIWSSTVLIMLAIAYFFAVSETYSREASAFWFSLVLVLLIGWRYVFRRALHWLRSKNYNTRTAIIVALNQSAVNLANEFLNNPRHGIRFLGFYDDREPSRIGLSATIQGSVNDALHLTKSGIIDNVYIALPLNAEKRSLELLESFSDTTATVYLIPNFFVYNLLYSRWQQVGDTLTLSIYDTPHMSASGWLKRIEDIILSIILIIVLAIPLLLIAIAIKATSAGPAIFKQDRYGLDGHKFKVFKFRTMTATDDGPIIKQATVNDPRITKIGRFLRKYSLDELPQIFNVFTGTMSLVGPRPHAVAHNEEYRKLIKGYMLRHKVRPGITGWAQVNGLRGETDTIEKMKARIEFDLDYIHKWSLWLDFKILFLTIYRSRSMTKIAY